MVSMNGQVYWVFEQHKYYLHITYWTRKKKISKSLLIDLAEKYFIKSAEWQAHHWGAPCGDRW